MALTLDVTPGDLTATFAVAGSVAAGTIYGAKITGLCSPSWATVGTFTVDGSQAIALARGPWMFFALSGSTFSEPQHVYIRNSDGNIHDIAVDAVAARLATLALPGIGANIQKRARRENVGGEWPAVLVDVPYGSTETGVATGGNNMRSDWGYPVRVTIADRIFSQQDPDVAVAPILELRRIAFAAFDRPAIRLDGSPDIFDTRVEPGAIKEALAADGGTGYHIIGSVFIVRVAARVYRGV